MKPIMPMPSPQFTLSAAACALAMAALALSAPSIGEYAEGAAAPVPVIAGIEAPSLPALPALLPR
jgi:hypothetical protein